MDYGIKRIIVTALVPKAARHKGKTGGISRLAEILKRFHNQYGFNIVLVSSERIYADYLNENGVSVEFKFVKSSLKLKSLLGLCIKSTLILIKSFFVLNLDFLESKNEKVIVYASSDLFWEVIPAFFFKIKKKKIEWIQVIHHIYPDWKRRPGKKIESFFGFYLQRLSFWMIRKKADKIIILNSVVKKDLMIMGFPENKIFVSSNGIDAGYFENTGKTESAYDGIFLGRLSHSKGIVDLIEIWDGVCQEVPEAKLGIIGGGSSEAKSFLKKKINSFGLEKKVVLLGFLGDKKAYPILKSGKVFLFPSHEEGWGIAIAEAMACGLPVVSWDLPVFKEIFENYTVQIKENDIRLFSKKVVELLKHDTLREKAGMDGKEFIKKYSWDSVAAKELEIISL